MKKFKKFSSFLSVCLTLSVILGNFSLPVLAYEKNDVNFEQVRAGTPLDNSVAAFNKINSVGKLANGILQNSAMGQKEKTGLEKSQQIEVNKKNYVEGEILVKYKNNKINLQTVSGRAFALNFISSKSLENKEYIKKANISVLKIKDSNTVEQKIAELKNDSNVEYVQPNYQYYPTVINTNDTNKDLLWGLDNTGQTVSGTYPVHTGLVDADIDAPEAWAISEATTFTPTIVAVIDSGVAYNHPDLLANMWNGTSCKDENGNTLGGCNHGYDYEDNDKTPLPTGDSHGTHIAGIIVAVKNNSKGIIGVAPQAKIMAIKSSLTTSDNIKSINFAKQNGAKVINASWTGTDNDLLLRDAITLFPGLFIAAAGNGYYYGDSNIGDNHDGQIHAYPSDYDLDNIISVAATDQNDALATFSDYGATSVDVGAPGTNIYSTIPQKTTILSESFEEIIPPAIPNGWAKGGTNNNWGTYSLDSGTFWGKVLYGDLAYPYVDNSNTIITSPTYNLSAGGANIDFYTKCDTEYITDGWADYMTLEFSSDGGSNFTQVLQWDEAGIDSDNNPSSGALYHFESLSIPTQYLSSNFKFRFRWVSNSLDNNYDGCLVDDVKITKYSDGSDEKYDYSDGTSMAAPHVAGLAALVWGARPSLTYTDVKNSILNTGDPLSSLAGKTTSGKRINAFNALDSVTPPIISNVQTATTTPNSTIVIWSTNEPAISKVTYSTTTPVASTVVSTSTLVTNHSMELTGLSASTTYYFYTESADKYGNVATSSEQSFKTLSFSGTTVSGNITENTTWTLANSPYIVTGTVQVLEGVTLTIEPGVTVKFNINTGLNIGGELIASGTTDNIIIFTSNSLTPKAGDWIGIKFFNTATDAIFDTDNNYVGGSIFKYCNINYSGYSGSSPWAVYSDNTSLFIDNNIIENNYYKAVYILGARSKITKNTIRNNYLAFPGDCGNGIVEIYSSQNIVKDNTITNNGINGFIISNSNNNLVQNNSFTYNACGIKLYGANNIIKNNTMSHNSFAGIDYYGGSGSGNIIKENDIVNNNNVGIYVYKYNVSGLIDISNNNIYGNTNYNLRLDDSIANMEAKNNYWGTTDLVAIADKIYDYYDSIGLGKVIYEPYATAELDFDDQTAPTLAQVTPVSTPTNDNTLNYTFSSNEAGTITYGGLCSSLTTSATMGNNTITFNALADGAYNNCTIKVTDAMSNESLPLSVSAFTVDTTSPAITILGLTPVNLTVGDPAYVDAGATALDNGTVDLTSSIVTTVTPGPVDTSATGTFTIHYNISDAAGNPATQATRTVNVVAVPVVLNSITITTPATKLSYFVGEPLDITGLVVTGTYSDATTQTETMTTANITGFDSSSPIVGQVLTITVGGKTTTYTVNIVAVPSSAKDINAFSFSEGNGVITGNNIAVTVPFGTNVATLIPTIIITGVSVNPASGVAQDFVNPVIYTVIAEDSSIQTYTVTVTVAANSAKDITSFSFAGGSGVIIGTNIAVSVPFSTDVTALVPTITITGDSVSPLSEVANNFTAPQTYTVTAADATTKVYTVTVTIAPNTEANIFSFNSTAPVADGVISGNNISLTVPFGTILVDLPITITLSSGASVLPTAGGTTFVDGFATTYTVTAQDGVATRDYSVTVNVAANTAKDITSFDFNSLIPNISGVISGTNITLNVPYGTDVVGLIPTIGITGASVSPLSGVAQDFTSPVIYTVTAVDNSTQDYIATVIVAVPSDLTALTAAIATAQSKYDVAVEGNIPGQYPAPLKANLQTAINIASAITNTSAQSVVDAAVITLNSAVATFEAGVVPPDTTAPDITLIGSNPMSLTVGGAFTDPGATAWDNIDGTTTVTASGSVDTSVVWSYTIIYTAEDLAHNVATTTRTVNIVAAPSAPPSGGGGGGGGGYTPPVTPSITKAGDANRDNKVDKYDFSLMMSNWGKTGANVCDFNSDGKVDKYDFALLMSKWGL